MIFSQYKDFKDFCEKNGYTSEEGLRALTEEGKKRGLIV